MILYGLIARPAEFRKETALMSLIRGRSSSLDLEKLAQWQSIHLCLFPFELHPKLGMDSIEIPLGRPLALGPRLQGLSSGVSTRPPISPCSSMPHTSCGPGCGCLGDSTHYPSGSLTVRLLPSWSDKGRTSARVLSLAGFRACKSFLKVYAAAILGLSWAVRAKLAAALFDPPIPPCT